MRPKLFTQYLARDFGCIHCGEIDAVAPHHRINRGMGGSKLLDRPSNIVVLCSIVNGLLESDPAIARRSRDAGWKLGRHEDPLTVPVYYPNLQTWFMLDDQWDARSIDREPLTPIDWIGI